MKKSKNLSKYRIVMVLVMMFLASLSCSQEKTDTAKTQNSGESTGKETPMAESIIWTIDNLERIGGNPVTVLGSPSIITTAGGKAVEFDGVDDGLLIDTHPLEGESVFTLEVIFRPDADGQPEQRFFHLQEDDSENRILIETRLIPDNRWYLDTYIRSGETDQTLQDSSFTHPVGEWYNATLVFDGSEMRHYVNGFRELSAKISAFAPPGKGKTSIGVRINRVYWFKGAIRQARFTHGVLSPDDFLKP